MSLQRVVVAYYDHLPLARPLSKPSFCPLPTTFCCVAPCPVSLPALAETLGSQGHPKLGYDISLVQSIISAQSEGSSTVHPMLLFLFQFL